MGKYNIACRKCGYQGEHEFPHIAFVQCPECKSDDVSARPLEDKWEKGISGLLSEIVDRDNARMDSMASIFQLHIRALCAHCECLGMNAENSLAVCRNETPPYSDEAYSKVLDRWGLVDEKGEPKI